MAIAFRAVGAVAGANSGNVASIGLPAGHTAGDLLILQAQQFDNVASTVAGYTLISSQTNGATCTIRIFAKFDNGAEAAPTLTHAAGGTTSCWIAAYSGVSNGLTLGTGAGAVFRTTSNSTGTGTPATTPSLAGLVSGDMRLICACQTGSDTSGAATANYTVSTSFTERIDNGRVGASSHAVGMIDDFLSSASATTSNAANGSGFAGTVSWIAFQIGISSDVGAAVSAGLSSVAPLLPALKMFSMPGRPFLGFPQIPSTVGGGPATIPQTMTADAVLATASMVRQANKNMSGTAVAVTASMVRQVNKFMSATAVAVTASLATVKVKLQAMTATAVVVTASMVRQVNKSLTATAVAATGSMVRQVNKFLTAVAVVVTASLATVKVKLVVMTASAVVVTASFLNRVNKALTATTVLVTASRQLTVNKAVKATNVVVTASMTQLKVILKAMTATAVVVSASMSRRVGKVMSASSSVLASLVAFSSAITGWFLSMFDPTVGHPRVRDTPSDAEFSSDAKGKIESDPQQRDFDA